MSDVLRDLVPFVKIVCLYLLNVLWTFNLRPVSREKRNGTRLLSKESECKTVNFRIRGNFKNILIGKTFCNLEQCNYFYFSLEWNQKTYANKS